MVTWNGSGLEDFTSLKPLFPSGANSIRDVVTDCKNTKS